MKAFLWHLTGRLPCRIISDNDQPYLERYYVGSIFGLRAYIHRFVGSDPAKGLHDHPWRWAVSLILSGGYAEQTRYGERRRRWINFLTGNTFHRVVLPAGRDAWTLFVHPTNYVKAWGFLKRDKVQHQKIWVPFNYPKNGKAESGKWWLYAPIGKNEPRRAGK